MATPPVIGKTKLNLSEMMAIVVGYALASVIFRAFWPPAGVGAMRGTAAAVSFAWLGLAMSGPLILIKRGGARSSAHGRSALRARLTRMEKAWCAIGLYWIGLGLAAILVVRRGAIQLDIFFWVTMLPVLLPFAAWQPRVNREPIVGLADEILDEDPNLSRQRALQAEAGRWTQPAAIALVATWPVAWACMIGLGGR